MSDAREPLVQVEDLGICYELDALPRVERARRSGRPPWREVLAATFARPRRLHWALRGVSLTCREGEVVGIVGPNGAGKTTLCLAISRILDPDEGRVRVRGEISTLLSLGTGFHRELSGRANIRVYGAFLGIPRARLEAKMDEIIDFTELGERIDEPISHYSTGMRARLAFAVATALDPDVLLLDEILSVGDPAFRRKSEARIRALMARSRLIVVVSHSFALLRELATHCLWLDGGAVRMYGAPAEVLDAYEASL
jgi:ABC-type polysaccharide/polyol phosphate transport system ATPase subunit